MIVILSFASCRSVRYIPVESSSDSIVIEKLVPVVNPADSANIKALLECDENGKILLRWYDTEVTKNANLKFQLDSIGRLKADFNVRPDTIYLPSKEIIVDRKVSVPYPVEKELTWWEGIKMKIGGYCLFLLLILCMIGIRKHFLK